MAAIQPTREGDFAFSGPFPLDGGGELPAVSLRYALYGTPDARRGNVVLVCHALSGSARVADWWSDLFGPGLPFDTNRFCVLGVNVLGSCYGSTGPTATDPRTGRQYAGRFPPVSIRDMVRAQARLLDHLEVERLFAVVGGSIGGMQALAWAAECPERVPRCIAIGACPLAGMGLALSHLQREMIRRDARWRGGEYAPDDPPAAGLALARGLAMCSYKSAELFRERFGRRPDRSGEDPARDPAARYDVGGYLDHQGRTFVSRFDANSYLVISKAMDTFELTAADLARIRARVRLIGISSDWLFPPGDVRELAELLRQAGVNARYDELVSSHGHDGFLADSDLLSPLIADALADGAPS
jgi:homoserine O-acetyltransferase/O-succinyltransferase